MRVLTQLDGINERHHHEAIVAAVQTAAGQWSSLALLGPAAVGVGVRVALALRAAVAALRRGEL